MREPGYYWVKFKGEPVSEVAVWLAGHPLTFLGSDVVIENQFWLRGGSGHKFLDEDIESVGPRIAPPAEGQGS